MVASRVAVIAVLLAAPAFASATVGATFFKGALTDDAPRLRLAAIDDDEARLAAPLENLTAAQLQAERHWLEDAKPGLGVGIAMVAIGGGLTVTSLGVIAFAVLAAEVTGGFETGFIVLSIISAACFLGGAALIIIGCIKIGTTAAKRAAYNQRIDDINARLEPRDSPAPATNELPPPGAMRGGPQPSMVLATF